MIEAEVKALLDKHGLLWSDFMKWMIGKTMSSDKQGRTIYWTGDVQRFIHKKK
jgi:hypothetical protein